MLPQYAHLKKAYYMGTINISQTAVVFFMPFQTFYGYLAYLGVSFACLSISLPIYLTSLSNFSTLSLPLFVVAYFDDFNEH